MKKEEEVDIYLEDRYDEVAESLAENPDAEILTKADVPEEKEEKAQGLKAMTGGWRKMLLPLSRQGMPILLQRKINKLEISRISDMIRINLKQIGELWKKPCFLIIYQTAFG